MPRNLFPSRMAAKKVSDNKQEGEEPRTEGVGEFANSKIRGTDATFTDDL